MDEKNFSHDQSVAEMPFLSGIHQNTYANLTSAGVVLYTAGSAWSLVRNIPKVKSSLETSRAILEKEVPIALKVAETGKVALEKSSVNIAIASLESTEAPLKEIKKINNSLYPEMQKKFEKITQMAGDLPYISASDVANVVAEYQLEPKNHIDLTAVEAANQLVDQNLEKVDQIITGLKTAAEHIEQDDQEWSVKFATK